LLWNIFVNFTITIEITVPKLKGVKIKTNGVLNHTGVYKNESEMANIEIIIKMTQKILQAEVNTTCKNDRKAN